MRFLFRADASVEIGAGHVVRCAALAQHLRETGHAVEFCCGNMKGNLNGWLAAQDFPVTELAVQGNDATATMEIVAQKRVDWVVVDHYGLGVEWETLLGSTSAYIMAFDDIGRPHDCDVLLDQNFTNSVHALYRDRVPSRCELLLGPQFAMIRPEFPALRVRSLSRKRRKDGRLLVFMGGSDATNETVKALKGIVLSNNPDRCVDVVIGEGNMHRAAVEGVLAQLSNGRLHVQTPRMADLMAAADLAIGAGGSATWERCVLGLPALAVILADNQALIAEALTQTGAQQLLGWHYDLKPEDYAAALDALDDSLERMSEVAANICDGGGVQRVTDTLLRVVQRCKGTKPQHA